MADVHLPHFFAVPIESKHTGFAEENIDMLAISDGRAAGVTVFGQHSGVWIFGQFGLDRFVPNDFSGGAIDADEMALEFINRAAIVAVSREAS